MVTIIHLVIYLGHKGSTSGNYKKQMYTTLYYEGTCKPALQGTYPEPREHIHGPSTLVVRSGYRPGTLFVGYISDTS